MGALSSLQRWCWLYCWRWLLGICILSIVVLYFQVMAIMLTAPGAVLLTCFSVFFVVKFILRAVTFPGSLFLWKKNTEAGYTRGLSEILVQHTALLGTFLRLVAFDNLNVEKSQVKTAESDGRVTAADALANSRELYVASVHFRKIAAILTVQNAMQGDDVFPEAERAFIGDFLALYTLLNEINAFMHLKVHYSKVEAVSRVLEGTNGLKFIAHDDSGHSKFMEVEGTILTLLSLPLPRKVCHRITKFGLNIRSDRPDVTSEHQEPPSQQPSAFLSNETNNNLSLRVVKEIAKIQSCLTLLEKMKPFIEELADPAEFRFINCISWLRNYCKDTCLGGFSYLRAELVFFSGAMMATVPTSDNCSLDGVFFPADKKAFRAALNYCQYGAAQSTNGARSPRFTESGNTHASMSKPVGSSSNAPAAAGIPKYFKSPSRNSSASSTVSRTVSTSATEHSSKPHELELAPAPHESSQTPGNSFDQLTSSPPKVSGPTAARSTQSTAGRSKQMLQRHNFTSSASTSEVATDCSAQLSNDSDITFGHQALFGVPSDDLHFCSKVMGDFPALDLTPLGPTVIYFNTNASFYEISYRHEAWLHFYLQRGLNVFMYNFRGFGRSSGRVSPRTLPGDAAAVYDYLRGLGCGPFGIHGRSIGGSCAIHVAAASAANEDVLWLFADRTFASLTEAAAALMGNWTRPILKIMGHDVDNVGPFLRSRAYKISACDPGDTIIPLASSLHTGLSVATVGDPILKNSKREKEHFLRKVYGLFKRRTSVSVVASEARRPVLMSVPTGTPPDQTSRGPELPKRSSSVGSASPLTQQPPAPAHPIQFNHEFVRELLDAWHFLCLVLTAPDLNREDAQHLAVLKKLLHRMKRRESSVRPTLGCQHCNIPGSDKSQSYRSSSSSTGDAHGGLWRPTASTHAQQVHTGTGLSGDSCATATLSDVVLEVYKIFSPVLLRLTRILGNGINAAGQSFENAAAPGGGYPTRSKRLTAFLANLQIWGCEVQGTAAVRTGNDAASSECYSGHPATSAQSLEAFLNSSAPMNDQQLSAVDAHISSVRAGSDALSLGAVHSAEDSRGAAGDCVSPHVQTALRPHSTSHAGRDVCVPSPADVYSAWIRHNSRTILHTCRENFTMRFLEFRSHVLKWLARPQEYNPKQSFSKASSDPASVTVGNNCELHSTTTTCTTAAAAAACNGYSAAPRGSKAPRTGGIPQQQQWTQPAECIETVMLAVLGSLSTLRDFIQLLHSHFQCGDCLEEDQLTNAQNRNCRCGRDSVPVHVGCTTKMLHRESATLTGHDTTCDRRDVGFAVIVDCGHNGNFTNADLLVVDFHLAQSGLVPPRNLHPKALEILETARQVGKRYTCKT